MLNLRLSNLLEMAKKILSCLNMHIEHYIRIRLRIQFWIKFNII